MKQFISFLAFLIFASSLSFISAQEKNKGVFVKPKDGFYQEIQKSIDEFQNPLKEKKKIFKSDFTGMDLPKYKEDYVKLKMVDFYGS